MDKRIIFRVIDLLNVSIETVDSSFKPEIKNVEGTDHLVLTSDLLRKMAEKNIKRETTSNADGLLRLFNEHMMLSDAIGIRRTNMFTEYFRFEEAPNYQEAFKEFANAVIEHAPIDDEMICNMSGDYYKTDDDTSYDMRAIGTMESFFYEVSVDVEGLKKAGISYEDFNRILSCLLFAPGSISDSSGTTWSIMRSSPDMVISISEDESVNGFAVGEDHCNYEDILVKDRPYDIDVLYSLATKITGDACYALIDYLYDKREEFEKAGVKVLNCRKDMREIFDGLMEDLEEGQEEHLI